MSCILFPFQNVILAYLDADSTGVFVTGLFATLRNGLLRRLEVAHIISLFHEAHNLISSTLLDILTPPSTKVFSFRATKIAVSMEFGLADFFLGDGL